MKLKANRKELLDALSVAASVVPTKSSRPVLGHVLANVTETWATFAGTDLEMSARALTTGVQVKEPGKLLIPAKQATALLKEIDDESVTLSSNGEHLEITAGTGKYTLACWGSIDDFPKIEFASGAGDILIDREAFLRMVERTIFAAAREETRYAINGVLLEVDGLRVRMVGTDGRRMAIADCDQDEEAKAPLRAILPVPALQSIVKAAKHTDDEHLSISLTTDQAHFNISGVDLSCRLLENRFPEYEQVIPKLGTTVDLDTEALASAVRRVAIMAGNDIRIVNLAFRGEELAVSAEASGVGRGQHTIELPGASLTASISFNPDYLLDALKVADDRVSVRMADDASPALFALGEGSRYALMPISGS